MRWVKNNNRIKIISILAMLLSIGPISWIVYGNDEKDIKYTIKEEIIEDGRKAKLMIEMFATNKTVEICSIVLPDGNIVEQQTNITYEVVENKQYEFIIKYKLLEKNKDNEMVEEEREEVITYQEKNILDVQEEVINEVPILEEPKKNNLKSSKPEVYAVGDVVINATNFPDETFRNYLLYNSDEDAIKGYGNDGVFTVYELSNITYIGVQSLGISNLKGIEYFTNLTALSCYNNQLTSIDISKNTLLDALWCYSNQLTRLDVSGNSNLKSLRCATNRLTAIDVSQNLQLVDLQCYNNPIGSLNVVNNKELNWLDCSGNELTSLEVSSNTKLHHLTCYKNQLTSLDISKNIELIELNSADNLLSNLDVSKNSDLEKIECYDNQLINLDLSNNSKLTLLKCSNNKISNLNLSNNALLSELSCSYNQLATLDLSKNKIISFEGNNQNGIISMAYASPKWISSSNINYGNVTLGSTGITYNSTNGQFSSSNKYIVISTFTTKCTDGNSITRELSGTLKFIYNGIAIDNTNFPDEKFRNYILTDESSTALKGYGKDAQLTTAELADVTYLGVQSKEIQSLEGIENFTKLETLSCYNNQLINLDVSKNTALTALWCYENQLTSLNISRNSDLTSLRCNDNKLTTLDVSSNSHLSELWCYNNQLINLNISSNSGLTSLKCNGNKLTTLDVSSNSHLSELWCYNNQLINLNTSNNSGLTSLRCNDNKLTALDVSNNRLLSELWCHNNQLIKLNLSYNRLSSFKGENQKGTVPMAYAFPEWKSSSKINYGITSIGNSGVVYTSTTGQFSSTSTSATSSNFSVNCVDGSNNVRQLTGILNFVYDGVEVNEVIFPDKNFRNYILTDESSTALKGYGKDTQLTTTELANITYIGVQGKKIQSLKGIEYFTSLTALSCYNNQLTNLDVSKNTALTALWCYENQLTGLNISKNSDLTSLRCNDNKLTALDVSNNRLLSELWCHNNQLTKLNLSYNRLSSFKGEKQTKQVLMIHSNSMWKSNENINYEITSIENTNIFYDISIGQFSAFNVINKSSGFETDCIDGSGVTRKISGTLNFSYDGFIPITNIKDVPKNLQVGETITLSGTIEPSNATEKNIVWSIKDSGTTNAIITDNKLTVSANGTLILTATISGGIETGDYTQDISIVTYASPSALVSIPSKIELEREYRDETIEAMKEEEVSILSTTDTNIFDSNFYVQTEPSFHLLNTVDSDEWFTVQIYNEDNNQHTSKETPLAVLNSTRLSQKFYVKAKKDIRLTKGVYKGTMNFIIGYGESQ